jgi:hypothetical protein
MRLQSLPLLAATVLAVTVAGCGSGSDASTGGGDDEQLSITSPADGATVRVPFTLTWDSAVALGPPDSGKDHVHVFVDGDSNDYTVVGGTKLRLTDLAPGRHEVSISLQHADHTPVGPEDMIEVTVTGGRAPASEGDDGEGPYGY